MRLWKPSEVKLNALFTHSAAVSGLRMIMNAANMTKSQVKTFLVRGDTPDVASPHLVFFGQETHSYPFSDVKIESPRPGMRDIDPATPITMVLPGALCDQPKRNTPIRTTEARVRLPGTPCFMRNGYAQLC